MNANIVAPLLPLAIPINDCHPDPTNARTGHAIDRIAASLRQYGQRKPIVVNSSEGGKIEAGNGTWQAAKRLGWTHIAAVQLSDSHVDAIGYGLSDNRTGDMSGWDAEMLAILAESLPPEVYTGFEGDELEAILAELAAGEVLIPDPTPQQQPELLSERFIEIRCSNSALVMIQDTLNEWAEADDITVNIS